MKQFLLVIVLTSLSFGVLGHAHIMNPESCVQMCNSLNLRLLNTQTAYLSWSAIGALHVYIGRQSSGFCGLGLKVLWITDYEYYTGCGPNYCCCGVCLPTL